MGVFSGVEHPPTHITKNISSLSQTHTWTIGWFSKSRIGLREVIHSIDVTIHIKLFSHKSTSYSHSFVPRNVIPLWKLRAMDNINVWCTEGENLVENRQKIIRKVSWEVSKSEDIKWIFKKNLKINQKLK